MHSLRYIKKYSLKCGVYAAILISFIVLITLIVGIAYKGLDALRTHYLILSTDHRNYKHADTSHLVRQTLNQNKIQQYDPNVFDTQNILVSNEKIMIAINKNAIPQSTLLKLEQNNLLQTKWSFSFFKNQDSTQGKNAGIFNSMIGTIFTLLICMMVSIPLGIGTAIYLEEFAPKNKITSFIEINIKNLAAIPSVVYGLLGLILFVKTMEINRSSSLVGGLTLAMMAIPVIMIITQQALRSVSYRIREGALAMGSSKMQLLIHFVIPLSLPTILTGIVLSISRIIGETAPLIIIGMSALVTRTPTTFFDPTTTLPTQIYLWSDNIDTVFISKSCLAILFLLAILIIINSIALYLKSKISKNVQQ
ncbi:MAG: phosphate ABC transporter permease PstA [Rickettsiales bacterium]|nr:phosphate ABC transporter permease PstA [Rickettsiales bacterium]